MTNFEKMQVLIEEDLGVRYELAQRCAGHEGTEEEVKIQIEVAAKHGIELTREDFVVIGFRELTDEEMEEVAGGSRDFYCQPGKKYNCDTELWEDSFQSQRKGQWIKGKYVVMRVSTNKLAKAPILLGPKLGWVVRGGCDCI